MSTAPSAIPPIIWNPSGTSASNYDISIQSWYKGDDKYTKYYITYYRQLRFGSYHRSIEDAQQACWEFLQRALVVDDFIWYDNEPDTAAVGQTPDPVPPPMPDLYDMNWAKVSDHAFESCHGYDVIAPVIRRDGVADKIISGCWYTFYEGVRFGPRYGAAQYAKEACRLHHTLSYCSERDTATAVVMKVLNPTLPPSPTIDPTIDIQAFMRP